MNWVGFYTLIRREVERTFRVITQTIVTPLISAFLYIFIFGSIVGGKIDLIGGVSYISFVLPGILMMNVVAAAFGSTSSAVYFGRWTRNIQEILVAPLSHLEMVIGFTLSGVVRGILVGVGVLFIAVLFGVAQMEHFGFFLFYLIGVSAIFSLLGILAGLQAGGFEQLSVWNTFIITPLSFLGGVFYSISMLPQNLHVIALWNPFFYFADGIRFSMVGISEANQTFGMLMTLFLIIGLSVLVERLFAKGWRIRE
ncbi:MAG: ABC transporter permease [Patescibacteria group bacterium]|nr:ABC transporter permease [bacterium]MDZ4241077.1 ABC transporter permease [Patescibacteria group bacterium]